MKKLLKFILWIVIICVLIYGGMAGYKKIEKYIYPTDYSDLIQKYADENELPRSLVFAVIKCESGFDKNAVSNIGAKGLMQLTPETYEWVCSKYGTKCKDSDELFDPKTNIQAGCRLLKLHLKEFSSVETALAAYHAGRGITNKWLNNPEYSDDGKTLKEIPYKETSAYVDKVIKTIEKYKEIYNIE
ncbi:MAG: lytic transglycosylase domain-containing protein [Acutalibacteraceae bacterium]